uniref:(northern house mosquito) hypothetical protein n=1 Tax=Culex pipiens TaxID=7175 RepID=A0A8D8JAZ4_CULPI
MPVQIRTQTGSSQRQQQRHLRHPAELKFQSFHSCQQKYGPAFLTIYPQTNCLLYAKFASAGETSSTATLRCWLNLPSRFRHGSRLAPLTTPKTYRQPQRCTLKT